MNGTSANVDSHAAQLRAELLEATSYYSADYFSARQRFLAASTRLGLEHHALQIHAPSPNSEPLTIDITVAGAAKPTSALVLSSGVHGVEGLFGSAVQSAFLEQLAPAWQPPPGAAVVLIHAINPFGFAWRRRFNEDNVDLNRNFLLAEEKYAGSPPLSGAFRSAMKPSRPRTRFGFWTARMAMLALRHGIQSFWETLPVGQYDYPDWLYYRRPRARRSRRRRLNVSCRRCSMRRTKSSISIFTRGLAAGPNASCWCRNPKGSTTASGGSSISTATWCGS